MSPARAFGIVVLIGSMITLTAVEPAWADDPSQIVVTPLDPDGIFGAPSVGIGAVSSGSSSTSEHAPSAGSPSHTGLGASSSGGACTNDTVGGSEAHLMECLFVVGTAVLAQPTPQQLAARAFEQLVLPSPVPRFSPDVSTPTGPATVVGEHTWLWTDKAIWAVQSKRVQAGPVWAEAVAAPTKLLFAPSADRPLACAGPGTAYTTAAGLHGPSPDCDYVFDRPHDHVDATFAIQWSVRWTGSTGVAPAGGALPDMTSRAVVGVAVAEVQSLNAS